MMPSETSPSRLQRAFAQCAAQKRAALIPFVMAGVPYGADFDALLRDLPASGADIIEIGVAFSDPSADGVHIRLAGQDALAAGQTLRHTLQHVHNFRTHNTHTPIILMGYYNPILTYGLEKFATDAAQAGVDACIIVDLPPEEEAEYTTPCAIPNIRLVTPTTHDHRLPVVLQNAREFLYVVSVSGVTGLNTADVDGAQHTVARLRQHTALPVVVGFGIRDVTTAQRVAQYADGVVVGSALCQRLREDGTAAALEFLSTLRGGMAKL